jgi:uncharacterized glyoxalase superfamily protein PhnB
VPGEHGGAVPYLAVRGARAALDWYAQVLGARLRGEPIIMPDGRVGHAELELAGGVIYLAEEHPEIGVRAPQPGGVPVSLVLWQQGRGWTAAPTRDMGIATPP